MNRLLAMLLALCLLATPLPAALAEAAELPEADAPLPRIGDIINGFEVVELRDYRLVDATIVRFSHQKTGAELYYIANDDTNRAFDMTFFTDAIDNTGLPHVFEHATTAGSEKYPSSALWFNLEYQTYNTYMNAMTDKRFTSYPVASLSEAQLLKFADYYADSCFNPTIMKDDSVFHTEAWRYRLDDPEDELTYEGTVYSEMLGAWTLNRNALINARRAMFPGSLACNDSGGDPDCIPDMTWEMLKDYHERYYHPSNCAAYLYGQFDDYAAFLELLDGYFSAYERREFSRDDSAYTPIAEPVVQSLPFPMEQGSGTEHASVVYYGFVCPGLNRDSRQQTVMNTLTDLLKDDASALQQSLQEALPYGSFWVSIDLMGPEDAITFVAENVNPEDAETFKQTVDATLKNVAENGFPQDQVDGVMARLSISALLTRENSAPVNNVLLGLIEDYAWTGDPWGRLEYLDGMFSMDDWNRQGLYASAVSDWLVGSETTALVTTYPEPGGKEAHDAALAEKLAGIKAGMTDAEIADIVAASDAKPEKDDSSEYVAQLQAVTVDSLPEDIKRYELTDETDASGVRHIDVVAGVDGVGSLSILLDAAGLPQEDIHWFSLYTDLIGKLDTSGHTKAELAKQISRYLYGASIGLFLYREGDDGCHPYLALGWISMDDDLKEGYALARELAFDTKVDDPSKLLEQVQALKANLKDDITGRPATTLLRRELAIGDALYRYKSYALNLEYYDFLIRTEQQLADDPNAVVAKLKGIQAYFNNRTNAVTVFAGNADSIALNRELADAFMASLDARPIERVEYDLPVPLQREALVIDSGVQHNLLAACYEALGMEGFDGKLHAIANIVSDTFLYPLLRDQHGVYTPQHWAYKDEGVYIYAYRDPNIAETFRVLEELPALVADIELDQETLNGYILQAYSDYAMPVGELSGAIEAAGAVLEGRDPGEKLDWMRQLKQLTPEAVRASADMYEKLAKNGARGTAGSAAAINANPELFDAIYNPFGASDGAQALADIAEGDPHCEAVRFALEQGLMNALDEEAFGVDEAATNGDLLAALYALTGGSRNAEEALAAFVEYGLVPADTDLAAPFAPDDVWALLSAIAGEAVPALTETANADAVTRAELAEMLMAFAGDGES